MVRLSQQAAVPGSDLSWALPGIGLTGAGTLLKSDDEKRSRA
ncbi:MAG: hypothetical protein ABJA84_11340 [Polaromonas sp.]